MTTPCTREPSCVSRWRPSHGDRPGPNTFGVPRMTLQKLVTGKIRVAAELVLKLAEAFPHTTPEMWMNLQSRYELSREPWKRVAP